VAVWSEKGVAGEVGVLYKGLAGKFGEVENAISPRLAVNQIGLPRLVRVVLI
jgi:hypothetical protein